MDPLIIVILVAFLVSITTQIVNKLFINEKKADENNKRMKEIQVKLKGLEPNSHEFAKHQEEVLDLSLVNMKQQFKPMLITIIPFLLVFQMLSMMYAYAPIDINSTVKVAVGGNGIVDIPCLGINETVTKSLTTNAVFTGNCSGLVGGMNTTVDLLGKTKVETYQVGDLKMSVTPPKLVFFVLPFSIPFFGNKLGWLGIYFASALIFSTVLNKALKGVYLRKWQ